jgi:hypothetical protein
LQTSTTSSSKALQPSDYDTEVGLLITIGIAAYIGNVDIAIANCYRAAKSDHVRRGIATLAALPKVNRPVAVRRMVAGFAAQNVLSTK